jgi:hypothetical protein
MWLQGQPKILGFMSNPISAVKQNNPYAGLGRPLGVQEDEAPRFQDNRRMRVARLSAVGTGRLYPPGNIPGTHCF